VSSAPSVSSATIASTSPLWTASAKRPTSRRSPAESGRGARSRSADGRRAPQRRAGALERALDRALAGVEHRGDLGGAEAEHIAEHQRRALAGRQVLEGDRERELERFAGLEARGRPAGAVGDVLDQRVGVRVKPDRLDVARWLERIAEGRHLPGAARLGAQRVQAAIGRDPVQPGAHRRAALEPLDAAPRGQERLLHHVLGVLQRADDAVAVQLQLAPERFGQRAERLLIARARPGENGVGLSCRGHRS
jgi:hypothetical protein